MVMSTLPSFLVPSTGMYPVEQFAVFVRCPCQFLDPIMPFMILFGFFMTTIMHCVTSYCLIALMQLIMINLCIFYLPIICKFLCY